MDLLFARSFCGLSFVSFHAAGAHWQAAGMSVLIGVTDGSSERCGDENRVERAKEGRVDIRVSEFFDKWSKQQLISASQTRFSHLSCPCVNNYFIITFKHSLYSSTKHIFHFQLFFHRDFKSVLFSLPCNYDHQLIFICFYVQIMYPNICNFLNKFFFLNK